MNYSKGSQNIITDEFQMIRLSEGYCLINALCYEWKEIKDPKLFDLPEIVRNDVRITDMNILSTPDALYRISQFKDLKVNGKVVYPHLICGIDYRFLTSDIAEALKKNRFRDIHFAWDLRYSDQKRIKTAIKLLDIAGYKSWIFQYS